jgi:uncharacterized protein
MTAPIIFDWDEGNLKKLLKHKLTPELAESIFSDPDCAIRYIRGSKEKYGERRYTCVGCLSDKKPYVAVYTSRHGRLRIISARRCDPSKGRQLGYQYPRGS